MSKKSVTRLLWVFASWVITLALVVGCGAPATQPPPPPTEAPKPPVVATTVPTVEVPVATEAPTEVPAPVEIDRPLVVGLPADPEMLDPQQYGSSNAYYVIVEMFEGLVRHKPGTAEIEPWLAEKWDISADSLEYTFHLRQGVKFHDGTPFNAEAVKWNIERQSNQESEYYKMGTFWLWSSYMWVVKSAEVVDEYTIKIILSQPYAYYLQYATGGSMLMVSPAAVQKDREDFVQKPVGTGPYKFISWDKGQQIVLERNEEYWGQKPAIRQVVFKPYPEDAPKTTAMLTGEVNYAPEISAIVAEQLRNSENNDVKEVPYGAIWLLSMNVNWGPFKDVKVRQAVSHAINKQALNHDLLSDTVDTANGPISPAYPFYNPDITLYDYNPEKAKELLKEAGYEKGFEVKFDVPQGGSGMELPVEMATQVQADLAAVGITAKIEITDFNTWMERIRTEDVQLAEMSWNVPPTVEDDILANICGSRGLPSGGGFNTSWYNNPEVNKLIDDAAVTLDDAKRGEMIKQAQKIITNEAPAVWVNHMKFLYGIDKRLAGFTPNVDELLFVEYLSWKE